MTKGLNAQSVLNAVYSVTKQTKKAPLAQNYNSKRDTELQTNSN